MSAWGRLLAFTADTTQPLLERIRRFFELE